MARAFCIVYDAGGQKGLKKHTDGRKEGATLLLLLSTPGVDFEGGGTRFFPSVLEPSFDAKPPKGSTVVFPSDTLQRGAARKSTREKYCVDLREPPRHRADTVTTMGGDVELLDGAAPRGVESPRHRAEAARTLIFHAGTRACPSSGAAAYSSASSRPKRSAPAGRARPRRRPASAGPGPAARWTLRTWRTRAPGRRSRRPARTPASPWTAPRSARRSAPASCPSPSIAPTMPPCNSPRLQTIAGRRRRRGRRISAPLPARPAVADQTRSPPLEASPGGA